VRCDIAYRIININSKFFSFSFITFYDSNLSFIGKYRDVDYNCTRKHCLHG